MNTICEWCLEVRKKLYPKIYNGLNSDEPTESNQNIYFCSEQLLFMF